MKYLKKEKYLVKNHIKKLKHSLSNRYPVNYGDSYLLFLFFLKNEVIRLAASSASTPFEIIVEG